MDIAALEQALRKAFQANPNLALAGAAGLADVELPAEFARAAKTLAAREPNRRDFNSESAQWL